MKSLQDILKSNLKDHGLGEASFAAVLTGRANKHIADHMGNTAIKNIQIKKYENKKIFLEIRSSAWAQEFQFFRIEFLEKIRIDFPDKPILDLVIKISGKEDLYDIYKDYRTFKKN